MPPPVLLVIDEDQRTIDALESQLAQRYGHDYRLATAIDRDGALLELDQLADTDEDLALLLVGKSLSDTTGGEVLEQTRRLHPHAKRGLVVAGAALAEP